MILSLKQKISFLQDRYEISDGQGEVLYTAKQTIFSGNGTMVFDKNGRHIASFKRVTYSSVATNYELFIDGEYQGTLKRNIHQFRPEFTLNFKGWRIDGDIMHWDFGITDEKGHNVAYITKKLLKLTDTYSMNITNSEDALSVILIVLALDRYIDTKY